MKAVNCIVSFLKMWLLPVAMTTGTILYLAFANIEVLFPFKHFALRLVETLMPVRGMRQRSYCKQCSVWAARF